ncbi:MAG: hypothetical protein JW923_05185 [Spirochaetales bacterium]|nr:hypothetical protein [Spirochaetales bacterium]MBP7263174.1 hypothetical protein [Spirochaetia bacterium]
MKSRKAFALVALVLVASVAAFGQPTVSERKDVAIFSLGYYGWDIPLETLGTIDIEIQKVFLDLGRFNIIGMQQRFSSSSVDQFISILRQMNEENFVLPEEYQFGEALLTEADFNRLIGAFIVAVPVVTSYNLAFVDGKEWQADIKTTVSFIDVADGTLIGIADVETFGSSRETDFKAIQSAIDSIPMQLQYEIRSIPAFTLHTRVLGMTGGEVKIELGSNMGIQKGDEYLVIEKSEYEGYKDEKEVGLLLIKEVGTEVSTAIILYSGIQPAKDTQLRELPRAGADLALYGHSYQYFESSMGSSFVIGARFEATRGFYNVKPYLAAQMLTDLDLYLPLNAVIGAEYVTYMRRLEIGVRGGIAMGSNALVRILEESFSTDDDPWFTHIGVSAGAFVSYLVTRDMKLFAEVQADYLFGWTGLFPSYGGWQLGAGVTFKM